MSVLASCSNDEETEAKRQEFVQIVESRSTAELLNDLYVGSDGDIEAIARILNCTPSSIERIRNGETLATSQFAARVVDVCSYYYLNEQSVSILRAALDDEWGWYDDVFYFPKHHAFLVLEHCRHMDIINNNNILIYRFFGSNTYVFYCNYFSTVIFMLLGYRYTWGNAR